MGCKHVRLSDVATLTPGFAFKSKDFGNYDAKAIKITDVSDDCCSSDLAGVNIDEYSLAKMKKYLVHPGDYFLAMTGSIGKVGRITVGSAYLNQRVLGVRPSAAINKGYLWHLLNSNDFKNHLLTHIDSHSVQANISAKSVGSFEFDLPERTIQDAVASILGSFDSKIQCNTRLNGYLADAVDGLFEKALGQAEEKTLTDVVEILSGGTPKTKISEYWEDGEIPFFGPGDANGSTYCLTTAKRITQLGLENCNSELYPVDTVFLTARGTVGKVAMAGKPMAMNQSCFAFRGLGVSQPAVYQIIKRAVRSLKAKANGATFAAINTRDLKIETILVPSAEELTAFEEEAASLHSMMRVNEEESLKLSSLRDALLPKLIAGEIDVSKIDFMQLNSHLA